MIPKVNLADPTVEPTDEELDALSKAALQEALDRYQASEDQFQARMSEALEAARRQEGGGDQTQAVSRPLDTRRPTTDDGRRAAGTSTRAC